MEVREVCEHIWRIEKQFDMINLKSHGVPVYQMIRQKVYYDIVAKANVYEDQISKHVQGKSSKGLKRKLISLLLMVFASVFKNPFLSFKSVDELYILHMRKKPYDGGDYDIYSHDLIKDALKAGKKVEILDRNYENKGTNYKGVKTSFLDFLSVYSSIVQKIRKRQKLEHLDKVIAIENELNKTFGISYNLSELLENRLNTFLVKSAVWKRLFKLKKIKSLTLVVGYGWGDLYWAAKQLGIKTREVQHGIITKYHLGYSYPNYNKEFIGYPDELLLWGDFWKNSAPYPLADNKLKTIGFKYFQNNFENQIKLEKDGSILVLSQGGIGNQLAEFIELNLDFFKQFKVNYKLHPSEYKIWKEYPSLLRISQFSFIEIIDHNDIELYDLMQKADIQVGVFSTALFEGIAFKCKTLVVQLSGSENLDNLVSKGFAKKFSLKKHQPKDLEAVRNISFTDHNSLFYA